MSRSRGKGATVTLPAGAVTRAGKGKSKAAKKGGSSGWIRVINRCRPHLVAQKYLVIAGLAALFAEVGARLLEPWPTGYIVDRMSAAAGATFGSSTTETPTGLDALPWQVAVAICAGGLIGVVALRALAAYCMTVCFALAGNRVLTRIRAELFAHLNSLSLSFHEHRRTGDLVTRVTSDVIRLQEAAVTAALPLLGNFVTLLGMLTVITIMDWQLALVVLGIFPVFAFLNLRLSKKITKVSRKQREAEGSLASMTTESLASMRVIQSYSLAGRLQERFESSNQKTLKNGVEAKKLSAGLERKTDVLVGVGTAIVLGLGATRVMAGVITPGELTVFLTYLKTAMKPLRDIAKYTARIAKAGASGERIVDILDLNPRIADAPKARELDKVEGWVTFDDVWFAYNPGHWVLKGISFVIKPGTKVAIVGHSGSGKSSVVSLLSRLRDPDLGTVRIDGHDLRQISLESVRPHIASVLQESVLFVQSIRDNIALGVDYEPTEEEIIAAAKVANAHDFIMRLPEGYDTVVGERGGTLSGGQRQRIAIARAAIRKAPIIILDEALTGLDPETQVEVGEALDRLCEGKTTLIVTHDMDYARDADRVIWIDAGVIRGQGDPETILAEIEAADSGFGDGAKRGAIEADAASAPAVPAEATSRSSSSDAVAPAPPHPRHAAPEVWDEAAENHREAPAEHAVPDSWDDAAARPQPRSDHAPSSPSLTL
ncbi:MAG: ATP-binding cassette domain-containing protein [Propionibacteriaceae bacterium]|jgi:ATP-binding cassette subfamily B protein|nr:ATP-binding cassette domain-containing protein [Propionibacteriaceae bacterium]